MKPELTCDISGFKYALRSTIGLAILSCLVMGNLLPVPLQAQQAYHITVNATINPATAGFIARAINKAVAENASCLIIQLNTPGGLLESTRDIVGGIMSSPIPVLVYVSPPGAHAGSAGVFITLSAHVAAMAPGTNIGAAHPIAMQGGMDTVSNEKAVNDAAAFIRTIAEKRNRNVEWAEDAVRNSVSITAKEAVDLQVVDFVSSDLKHLLVQADSMVVEVASGMVTLQTANVTTEVLQMTFVEKLLNILSDPNIAYILLMFGVYGVLFELYNPGAIFPGIIGGLGLILGFYALSVLPLNYTGLALIIFSVILFLLEIKVTSYGMLAIGGIIAFALGSAMLIRPDVSFEFPGISYSVIITVTIVTALFFLFLIGMGIRAQRNKPVIGPETFVGELGEAVGALDPIGNVLVHGELWRAESISGIIPAGEKVRVTGRTKFTLYVELLKKSNTNIL
jgi:membrane-bound serine protease (ClpP class)